MNNRSANLIFYAGAIMLSVFVIWFFILYGVGHSGANQKPDISESVQNTQGMITDYNYDVKVPSITFHKVNDQTVGATINVGGIMTAIIGGSVTMVLSKLLNRYWPDKKRRTSD